MSGILIAPYNDSMRLGQGYNSFLHRPCVLNAVKFTDPKKDSPNLKQRDNTSQTVDYSSRFVDKISEVAKSMNVSAGSSIKNGALIGSGSSITLDEAKFTESDLNAVVSVKVINQTTELLSDASFLDPGIPYSNDEFFATYGNCYISVSWSGGGQIKPETQGWTLDSLYSAAAAFPANVARCPQKTWAILTPYYHLSSFLSWSKTLEIKVPKFDGALVYANVLLDMFMEYKTLVGRIQAVLNNPVDYIPTQSENPIRVNIRELLGVRKILSMQMKEITKTVDQISLRPEDVEEIENAASIQEPELWSGRIPIHKPNEENSDEWTTARAAEILSNFSFSAGRSMEHELEDEVADSQPLHQSTYPLVQLAGHELSLMEDEKSAFSTDEARENFKDLWIGLPVGGAEGKFFNMAPGLVMRNDTYPTSLGFHMCRNSNETVVLGWMRTSYEGGAYKPLGASDVEPVESVVLDLEPDERVVRVRMSKHKESKDGLVGIAFLELSTSAGKKVSIGSSKGLKIVDTVPEDPSHGLMGWYGRELEDGPIDRLGTIWK
ncbi:hypothetical protein J7337_013789 [Fusarium musae]|uniref:Uncharacterized protein n=1 Tax=Fusarium musae TaxID=1042133 RepID=A0A9P8D568_9HYPO|nr:hypothetical protein J7337_013789 [Fusarium musae]KAG9495540.1 hypothetical protein J7337_013789 [Fusarium musae]